MPDTTTHQPLLDVLFQHSDARLAQVRERGIKFAHYTSAENALNIIAGRSMWLRNATVMNDHSEIAHGTAILTGILEGDLGKRLISVLDEVHDGLSNNVRSQFYRDAHDARERTFMTSLCEHEHADWLGRLSMWRAYGGSKGGVALVFNPDVVTDPGVNVGLYASPVLYGGAPELAAELGRVIDGLERNPHVLAAVEPWMAARVIAGALHFALLSTKHPGFQEEREWRILCMPRELTPDSVVRPMVQSVGGIPQKIYKLPFDGHEGLFLPQFNWSRLLDRIIVGPSLFPETIQDALESKLKEHGFARWDQIVSVSEIPLRQTG